MSIDWSKIKFVARKDTWFVENSEPKCLFHYLQPALTDKVENNGGLFEGMTNETYDDYKGELPRMDEEGCPFDEFDIYLNNELINNITYQELIDKMK